MKKDDAKPELDIDGLLVEAYMTVQKDLEGKGELPGPGKDPVSAHRDFFVTLGGVEIGFLVAALTILVNFIVINRLFHLRF